MHILFFLSYLLILQTLNESYCVMCTLISKPQFILGGCMLSLTALVVGDVN